MLTNYLNAQLSENFQLKTLVTVNELAHHDMIYIYHHIKSGSVVDLEFCEESLLGELNYWVRFKGFTLGKVVISGVLIPMYDGIKDLQATVENVSKQKFLPLKGLDISIRAASMKLVS